jgi:MoxR-like ATPase
VSFLSELAALPTDLSPTAAQCRKLLHALRNDITSRVIGQENMVNRTIQAAVLNRHTMVEGLPGEAKTTCVMEFAHATGLRWRRISFRPDMLPSDLTGKQQLVEEHGTFRLRFQYGPLFSSVVIADEINRAPPKVHAAALEAMQERRVTWIDGGSKTVYHPDDYLTLKNWRNETCFGIPIPDRDDHQRVPFLFVATQNPLGI